MKQLIVELSEPRIYSDGVIRQPTAIMLKAAKTITEVLNIWEQDKQGRLRAEAENAELRMQLIEMRLLSQTESVLQAKEAYKEVANIDYVKDFT